MELYANHIGYSDINPYEIVRVVSDKALDVRAMDAEPLPWDKEFIPGGFAGTVVNQHEQKWAIVSNPGNGVVRIRLHKDGKWRDADCREFSLSSTPHKFYDYNF